MQNYIYIYVYILDKKNSYYIKKFFSSRIESTPDYIKIRIRNICQIVIFLRGWNCHLNIENIDVQSSNIENNFYAVNKEILNDNEWFYIIFEYHN